MRIRNFSLLTLFLLSLFVIGLLSPRAARAQGVISLRANRTAVLANGKDAVQLIAEIRDPRGRQQSDRINVQFNTDRGTLSAQQAQTFGGTASVRLTGVATGIAHVTA